MALVRALLFGAYSHALTLGSVPQCAGDRTSIDCLSTSFANIFRGFVL